MGCDAAVGTQAHFVETVVYQKGWKDYSETGDSRTELVLGEFGGAVID